MALGNLNVRMEGYVHDEGTDTRSVLGRVGGNEGGGGGGRGRGRGGGCGRKGALLLAFRGTLSSRNMLTDLKMQQVAFPSDRVLRVVEEGVRGGREGGRTQTGKGAGGAPGGDGGQGGMEEEEGKEGGWGGGTRVGEVSAGLRTPIRDRPRTGWREGGRKGYGSAGGTKFISASPVAMRWTGPGEEGGELSRSVGWEGTWGERRPGAEDGEEGRGGGGRGGTRGLIRSQSSGATAGMLEKGTLEACERGQRVQGGEGPGGARPEDRGRRPGEDAQTGPALDAAAQEETRLLLSVEKGEMMPLVAPGGKGAGQAPGREGTVGPTSCGQRALAHLPALRHALPHVHAGFWSAYLSVRTQLLSAVESALAREGTEYLYCTGHSLGGALAQLAAYDLSINFPALRHIQVYTLGAPRVGNPAFSSAYEARVPATFRVVVDGDLVPGMPKIFGMYRHSGVEVLVDAENGGNLIVSPSAVEKWLRLRNRTSTTNHSLTTYRDCMEACFSPDDLVHYLPKVLGQENRTSADEDLPEWLVGRRRSTFVI